MSASLISGFLAGRASAFARLVGRYWDRQVAQGRRALGPHYPGAADPEDIALSVFLRLRAEAAAGRPLATVADTAGLLRALAVLTRQKVARVRRDDRRLRRAVAATTRQSDRGAPDGAAASGPAARPAGGPLELPPGTPADLRPLAELLAAGYTHAEAADRLGCGVRTVERRADRLRGVLRAAGWVRAA